MPYVRCPRCGLRTFSAAYWSNVDHCGRCDAELPRPERFYGRLRSNIDVEPRQRGSSGNRANQR